MKRHNRTRTIATINKYLYGDPIRGEYVNIEGEADTMERMSRLDVLAKKAAAWAKEQWPKESPEVLRYVLERAASKVHYRYKRIGARIDDPRKTRNNDPKKIARRLRVSAI